MRLIFILIFIFTHQVSISQDTLTIKEIEKYENELIQMNRNTDILLTIGISLNLIAITSLPKKINTSTITYGLAGLLFDYLAISQYIKYKKRELFINKLYIKY